VDVADVGNVDDASDGSDASPPNPLSLAPGNLVLWLRGDQKVECDASTTPARVVVWGDLSGTGNHARAPIGKRGPVCDAATINGQKVVSFPVTAGAQGEEHLEIDLKRLANRGFTLAVVERRTGERFSAWMIGSKLPRPDSLGCTGNMNVAQGLLLGYDRSLRLVASTWGENCDLRADVDEVTQARVVVATMVPGTGFTVFADGVEVGSKNAEPLASIDTGFIGRGFEWGMNRGDSRYQGEIAEVVIYDVPLATKARTELEAYLRNSWTAKN
jgi:hypothetical protein